MSVNLNNNSLHEYLVTNIKQPISLEQLMSLALYDSKYGFYARELPYNHFVTSPKISQMFAEIVAAYVINYFIDRNIKEFTFIEIGGGDGTFATDFVRIAGKYIKNIIFIDNSLYLQSLQFNSVNGYNCNVYNSIDDLATYNEPVFIFANELFDAMPIRQFKNINSQIYELFFKLSNNNISEEWLLSDKKFDIPDGGIYEYAEYAEKYFEKILNVLNFHPNSLFITFDYGYVKRDCFNSTLQSIKNHQYVNWFNNIGDADLTYHVDFASLYKIASKNYNCAIKTQSEFLIENGILLRATNLKAKNPHLASKIENDLQRLINKSLMGELFKCLIVENK